MRLMVMPGRCVAAGLLPGRTVCQAAHTQTTWQCCHSRQVNARLCRSSVCCPDRGADILMPL